MTVLSGIESNDILSEKDIEFLNRLANKIHKSGFVTPSIFFLEMVRPLSSLGGHAMVFMGPIITGFVKADGYYRAAELLNNKQSLVILLDEIERLEMLSSKDDKGQNN
ncbi:MAG: hypothetical protein CBD44_03325 [Flavobacteriaceae bacterium TMED184]|nr:MAG: hypothetical protein CBD44_03325 [Flavobacteriaceae bacterium TMED184]